MRTFLGGDSLLHLEVRVGVIKESALATDVVGGPLGVAMLTGSTIGVGVTAVTLCTPAAN